MGGNTVKGIDEGRATPGSTHILTVDINHIQIRLDSYLAQVFTAYSRSFLKDLIVQNCVHINTQKSVKPSSPLKKGDTITITFPQKPAVVPADLTAHGLAIEIIYTHEHFLIINKPANLIMHHAAATREKPTLADWLIHHEATLAHVGSVDRPGIVHRLDKDTSGLLIIARTNYAHTHFTELFKQRAISKTYLALVQGHPPAQGSIDFAIGRNRVHKHKMASFPAAMMNGKERHALTHYRVLDYFDAYALVECTPVTGRTHQIRVHCAAIGHPLLGDTTYNNNPLPAPIKRHALHAAALSFTFDGMPFSFTCPLPTDMAQLIKSMPLNPKSSCNFSKDE
ncbi:MAG: RluA family pseudouridine synthase [Candidatus Babeliales bacterium]